MSSHTKQALLYDYKKYKKQQKEKKEKERQDRIVNEVRKTEPLEIYDDGNFVVDNMQMMKKEDEEGDIKKLYEKH